MWSLFYFIKEGLLKCGLYLQGGLYTEVDIEYGNVGCITSLNTY